MGKLFEILRHNAAKPAPVLPLPPRPAVIEEVLPIHAELEPEPADEDYLFIEVGAGKKLASPAVLDVSPKSQGMAPCPQPAQAEEKKLAPAVAPVLRRSPDASGAGRMSVSFEAWPPKGKAVSYVAPEVIAYHQPEHPAAKQYAALFQNVIEGLGRSPVLVFSGAAAKSGATTVLLNLAFSGSRQKQRIALVDMNFARPALAERLGVQGAPGWHQFLDGQVGLEKALQATAESQLSVLTAGEAPLPGPFPPEAYRWVLGWLRERFDLVLIDGPEASDRTALSVLLPPSDGLYLVLPQTGCEGGQLADIAQSIIRMGGRVRGLIHTQFESL